MKKLDFKKINKKRAIKWILIIGVIGFIGYSFINKGTTAQETAEVMSTQSVIGNIQTNISGTGTLSPADQYEVKSLVKGTILEASFEEGDKVAKGGPLFQISTQDIENSIKSSQLSVKRAKSSYKDIVDKKDNLKLYSKKNGYIKKLYVVEGETVTAGKTIADLYDNTTLYLDVLFPSDEAKNNWIGKKALVSLAAIGEDVKGVVTNVSSMDEVMEGGILTNKVTISVDNPGGIQSGDIADATISGIKSSSTGIFRAAVETTLIAESEGTIVSLHVKEGQYLKKDSLVLTLSSKDLDRQIETAEIGIEEAELSLKSQENQMQQYKIESPISGTVIIKNKKQGDTIDPSADAATGSMATIYDMSYLTFQMNIDELQISSVKVGQKVTITTEAITDKTFDGIVDRISLKGNTNNGVTSYPVIIKVVEFSELLPGMNVNGKILMQEANNVLTIPSSALQKDNVVYIQTDEIMKDQDPSIPKGYKPVTVTIGLNDGSNVEIKSGLNEGDTVYIPFDNSVSGYYDQYE
ncbi:MAG: family efflux transporter, subunit [Anaerocolumna sp.]|jgi:HlyD family secretion protein|nr:family efflux transporter, subunit [Anaerocolumna sp.]